MDEGWRDFIVELRRRYVRFESGAGKRAAEERQRAETLRRAHRAAHNIVAPPFTAAELMGRGVPRAPRAPEPGSGGGRAI